VQAIVPSASQEREATLTATLIFLDSHTRGQRVWTIVAANSGRIARRFHACELSFTLVINATTAPTLKKSKRSVWFKIER
jgi:hypothetical protein